MKALYKFFSNNDLKIILVALIYFLSAYIGLLLAFQGTYTSPVWPPVGIGLALVLMLGPRVWPGITIGSLVAFMLVFWFNDFNNTPDTIKASIMITAGNTLEILAGYWLLKTFIKNDDLFSKTNDTFIFLLVAMVMCIIGSSIGTYSKWQFGLVDGTELTEKWFFWWIPNVASVLLFTPFILSWKRPFHFKMTQSKAIEILIFLLVLSVFLYLINNPTLSPAIEKALPFLAMPVLLWVAFRFNLATSMTAILIAALSSIYVTINGIGPLVLDNDMNSIILLQIFIGVISITTIILSSTVFERLQYQRTIKKFNETLEAKISERTEKLNEEISTRKKAEDSLKITNRQLRKANVELDNFVYKVSHDLRAPIASVLGLVNLAHQEKDKKMIQEYIDLIKSSAQQQDIFIKDILDLSRNSRVMVERQKISFNRLINDTFEQLKYSSNGHKIDKKVNISGQNAFYSDERRLKVILNNIISNSIRYANGKDPVVSIDVSVDNRSAKISVEDNGVGIEKKHQNKIFDMFYRATDDNAGSGLGLYIVKESVEKLNGYINLESEPGRGTIISLEIPNNKPRNKT
ncbi:MASE1 domain-containing protein [Bacteroidota bacterium]